MQISGLERLTQQRLDQPFRFLIPALTDPHMANHALFVDEIHRRPVTIAIAIPRREDVVDGDGKADVVFLDLMLHLRNIVVVGNLRRMQADNHQPLISAYF